jgi:hypothetical protein
MSTVPALPNTLGFLTPHAYGEAHRQRIVGMEPNPDAIDDIGRITAEIDAKFALPVAARGLTIVLRGGEETNVPHNWDGQFAKAGTTQNYIPLDELVRTKPVEGAPLSKAAILALGRPVFELSARDFTHPLGPILAATILGAFHHPGRWWSVTGTLISGHGNPILNAKRALAVEKVRSEGLEPFTIHRVI